LRITYMAFLVAIIIPNLHAQVFEVSGGSSSLYQAQGGTVAVHGPSYNASIGAGVVAGQFIGGANLTKMVGRSTYILGDDYIRFELPTDIFDTSHYLIAQGVGVKTTLRDTKVFAFAGATSTQFNSPLFEGARAVNPAGIVFLTKQLTPNLEASSKMVFSRQTTVIESLEWQPAEKLKLGASGGIGANQPYGAASVDFSRPWIDLKAAYIEAGSQFQRVALETPLLSEPDRENVQVTIRPAKFISFSGGRQNFLNPIGNSQKNVRSSVNQVSGNLEIKGTGFSASLYHSTYLGESNNATIYSVDRSLFSRVHATASYLESRPNEAPATQTFIASFTEVLSPRWNVNQVVNRSQGQTTVSFGGGFLSNLFSISANYETYYVPQRNSSPFEQALILDVQVNLFHGITLHGATFVAPDGGLRYTADVHALLARDGIIRGTNEENTLERAAIGTMMLRGRVIDIEGHPIAGAALMLDQLVVYTNEDGLFYVRERKPRAHQLTVLVNQFLGGGVYRVVSAPAITRGSYEGNVPETVVIVQRVAPVAP